MSPPAPPDSSISRPLIWLFPVWLALFYATWMAIVITGEHWGTLTSYWPIALAMASGSYLAGSTPMGGGTVGFPVLVLLFDYPATLGRDFSFAVQAIGMTSASIYIIASGRPVAWRMLGWAVLGSAVGTPLGLLWIAPRVSPSFIETLFAVIWASFGIMTLMRLRELIAAREGTRTTPEFDRTVGLAVGFLGGAFVASVTGVGIDMLIYAVLILLVHADLRVAIPTSVILMAATSVIGITTQGLTGQAEPETFGNWLAAAPVVALGAPLGALVVGLIGRTPTLLVVSLLCVFQYAWTFYSRWEQLGAGVLALGIAGVIAINIKFDMMYRYGLRIARQEPARAPSMDSARQDQA